MISSITAITTTLDIADRTECGPWWSGFWQNEPFTRLYWVVDGEGIIVIDDAEYHLVPGWLAHVPARRPVRYYCPEGMDIYWAHCQVTIFGSLDLFSRLRCPILTPIPDAAVMQALWDRLLIGYRQATPAGMLEADGLLRAMAARFLEQVSPNEMLSWRQTERFREVLDYIERRLDTRLTLPELADVARLHPTYFANQFSRSLGEGPMAHVARRRIERAQALLWSTDDSIQTIAQSVGIADPFYFARLFRKITGISPTAFRRREGMTP